VTFQLDKEHPFMIPADQFSTIDEVDGDPIDAVTLVGAVAGENAS
jgi:hypothetical protein